MLVSSVGLPKLVVSMLFCLGIKLHVGRYRGSGSVTFIFHGIKRHVGRHRGSESLLLNCVRGLDANNGSITQIRRGSLFLWEYKEEGRLKFQFHSFAFP